MMSNDKDEKPDCKPPYILVFIVRYVCIVLFWMIFWCALNFILKHHFFNNGDIPFILSIVLYYLICVDIFGWFVKKFKKRFYKILAIIMSIITSLFGLIGVFLMVGFFEFNTIKLSVVSKPDYYGNPYYLTCENLQTKQMARIQLQRDYNSPFPMVQKFTYIDFDGKSYSATVDIDNLVDFNARINKDTVKGIIFNYEDHTCLMSTYGEKDTPSISGFFSWDDENYKDSSMRKMYAESYKEKHHPKIDVHKSMRNMQDRVFNSIE